MAPAMETDLGTCTSAEDGVLLRVADVTARLKALKPDPSKVFVAALTGPPKPYKVQPSPATLKDDPAGQWPQIVHSCMATDGTYADPAVRIKMLIDNFGDNGTFQVICNDTFAPALMAIGGQVARAISGVPCLDAGTNPDECTFVDHSLNDKGARVDTPLPSCVTNGNVAPCWTASASASCGGGPLVQFMRTAPPSAGMTTTATCP
jgi:hypothetical protein